MFGLHRAPPWPLPAVAALLWTLPAVCRHDPAQRVLRSDARALQGLQQGLRRPLEEETGETVTIQQSHGGSGKQARAVIDGLDADVVTLALAGDIDAIADKSEQDRRRTGRTRLPNNSCALHLDHRVPGPQGQPEGHQGLGRPGQAGRRRSSRRTRRPRAARAGTTSPPGATPATRSAATRPRPRNSSASFPPTCRCSTPARAARPTTFAQRGLGDVLLAWENEAYLALNEFGADKFEIVVPARQHPGRAAGGAGRRQCRRQGHAQGGRGLSRVPLLRRKARRSSPRTTTVRSKPERGRAEGPRPLPEDRAVHHRRPLRRLEEGAGRRISATAACSTRSTSRRN